MRKLIAATLVATAALPMGACTQQGNIFGPGERVYDQRAMNDDVVIYRDAQGRYYCRREDGTTGTLVGAAAGGVLGNIIAPGGSKTVGTILGALAGGVAGREIDRSDLACE
ncbi:glycine zipper 2TM domain-containing protein [Stakelama tenebrarum]|uniref:17 kDa surface antigen n=1 Tax=Stakelama tenebrarum TaxID=2711215 RepID=A0A6G6YA63_9SPHN|nr:glycine zipper 2TM domain-containing protein [Sphingosinithalassobacter tenebrarum]QIG81463.1 glycine zipper 2TM domain-containing protein [Sphingosinithalassobacter tenebrarum]